MTLPQVPPTAIATAIDEFDARLRGTPEWADWEANGNYDYAIVHDGRTYPVKQIVSMATGVPKDGFSGGPVANAYVEQRGFSVEPIRKEPPQYEPQIFVFTASNP